MDRVGQRGCQPRQERLDAVHDADDIGAGLALDVENYRRRGVHPRQLLDVFRAVADLRHLRQHDRGAVAVGDDQRAVFLGGQQLVVGVDGVALPRTVEIPLRLVDVGQRDRRAHILQGQSVGGQRGWIGLDAHRGLLTAADTDQAHSGQLRDALRQPGVGQILNLGQGKAVGGQRQGQNRRVGGIGLAVDRRTGQIARQVGRSGVD